MPSLCWIKLFLFVVCIYFVVMDEFKVPFNSASMIDYDLDVDDDTISVHFCTHYTPFLQGVGGSFICSHALIVLFRLIKRSWKVY